MSEPVHYKYSQPKRGSRYQQLAVNGRIRAEILYRETLGPEPLNPEQIANEYDLPVEAVLEAIHYCEHNRELLDAERAREQATIHAPRCSTTGHMPHRVLSRRDEPPPGRQQRQSRNLGRAPPAMRRNDSERNPRPLRPASWAVSALSG